VFHNARTVGSGVTLPFHAKSKVLNALNAMVPTSLKTTTNLGGVARPTKRLTLLDWRQRKGSHVLIYSSA